jgi:hypothetical protein
MTLYRYYLPTCLVLLLLILGCSGNGTTPTSPASSADDLPFIAAMEINDAPGHCLAGYWGINIDTEELTATVEPQRHPTAHMCLSGLLTPLITGISFNPDGTLDVDITIINPYPVSGYDLRGIMFLDNSFSLWNPDGWTSLCDTPDGPFFNPFKAYAKDEPNRIFAAYAEHTETYHVYFTDNMGYVGFGIEASYPGNCEEPYEIENFNQDVLFDEVGSEAVIEIDILDWQDDVNQVILMAQNITNEAFTMFTDNVNETWSTTLVNNAGVGPGDYEGLIIAFSDGSGGLASYDWVKITVSASELTVFDIEGPDTIDESTCEAYSVLAIGDTGITYSWTCDPTDAGYFSHPSSDMTDFCANPVGHNEQVELQVEVNSDGGGPILKTKNVMIINEAAGWPITWGSTQSDVGSDTVVDDEGNIYVAGSFQGSVVFPDEIERISSGGYDGFLAKFDPSGSVLWIHDTWGGTGNERVNSLEIGKDGRIYLCGSQTSGNVDFYLKVYENSGLKKVDIGWDVISSGDGNTFDVFADDEAIYITGTFSILLDFDPGPSVVEHYSEHGDVFTIKMDLGGNYVWGAQWGAGYDIDVGCGIVSDNNGNVYVTGYKDWHPVYHTAPAIFLKYDQDGNLLTEYTFGGGDNFTRVTDMDIDDDQNLYCSGYFNNSSDLDPGDNDWWFNSNGSNDAFLSKIDTDGNAIWIYTWGAGGDDRAMHCNISSNGYLCTAGLFELTVDIDPTLGVNYWTSNGGTDVFVSKFNLDGSYLFSYACGSTLDDKSGGAGTSPSNNTYGTGFFQDTVDFDPSPDLVERTSNGDADIFVVKLDADGNLVED